MDDYCTEKDVIYKIPGSTRAMHNMLGSWSSRLKNAVGKVQDHALRRVNTPQDTPITTTRTPLREYNQAMTGLASNLCMEMSVG